MKEQSPMTPEQSFFAVFCIESLSDELGVKGDEIYALLTKKSNILDSYIIPNYDSLHTQGKGYIVDELTSLMEKYGVIK